MVLTILKHLVGQAIWWLIGARQARYGETLHGREVWRGWVARWDWLQRWIDGE